MTSNFQFAVNTGLWKFCDYSSVLRWQSSRFMFHWQQQAPVCVPHSLCKESLKERRGQRNSHKSHKILIKSRHHGCCKPKPWKGNLQVENVPVLSKLCWGCICCGILRASGFLYSKGEWVAERTICDDREWRFQAHLAGSLLRNLSPLSSGWSALGRLGWLEKLLLSAEMRVFSLAPISLNVWDCYGNLVGMNQSLSYLNWESGTQNS